MIGRKVYAAGTMPFGLNMAPRVFTKIPKTVVQQLRLQGLQVAASLDDWLIRAQYPAECLSAARKVITFRQSKGFQIKFRRSRWTPLRTFAWLGLLWNLSAHTVSLPQDKKKEIGKSVRTLSSNKALKRRQQEWVMGSLQFASITDPILRARLNHMGKVWQR